MKFLAFILSIYIFALNLVPCEDYSVSDDESKIEISKVEGDEHQHHDSDSCSPFCICQCCHIKAIHFEFVKTEFSLSHISTQDFFYQNGTEKDFTSSILQPPRA